MRTGETTLNLKNLLADYKSAIDLELAELLESSDLDNFARSQLFKSIQYSVTNGGKRLRPILSLMTAEAIHAKAIPVRDNPALKLALAVELVHCGSLIHDDLPCMDDDDLRRGKPTNHKVYNEAVALLAGDTLLCYPIQVLLEANPQAQVINEFIEAIKDMIAGQAMDLELPQQKVSMEQMQSMQELKTGALLRASVVLAAKMVEANQVQIDALENYSSKIGLAFQIVDDILDVTASTEQLGKTAAKDIEQNKATYVKFYGLDKAGIMAQELIDQAKESLDVIPNSEKLKALADYVLSRQN
ncbi:MAG: polyprenyl synthetase family protein [Cyanobacteria bacterium]|nr:polyprenyl synthetase family protein [Cyanobacteriota bacterium]MDA1020272.1 polyprenyl synthetase family protein [Cyanobacteriota bacterium]